MKTENLLITGAGVDKTKGIDFPLAATLLPEITQFVNGEGKAVSEALRTLLPNLRFTFNSMIARAVDAIATRDVSEQRKMIQRVREAIENLPPEKEKVCKHGELLIKLFEKLATIAENAELDEGTVKLIKEVFPKDADELIDSDSILDIHKLSLSDTFKTVLKRTLQMGLGKEHHEVACAIGAEMLNVENLLVEKFLGFYNEKHQEIKNYIYISWMLWAYLVEKQKEVFAKHTTFDLPFYAKIPKDWKAVTLNYTSFLEKQLGRENVIYFHGGLAEYVRMDTRDLLQIEEINSLNILNFINETLRPNLSFDNDIEQQKHIIPALMPPLRLKPILSHRYIEEWHKASDWINTSERIIIVGYSFNRADEHFNDIVRQQKDGKDIFIIGPDMLLEPALSRFEKVLGCPKNNWVDTKIQNKSAKKNGKIRIINALAAEINLSEIR